MPKVININGVDFPQGSNNSISLNIAKLPTHTVIDIPIYVYRSKKTGPTLLLIAGIHGSELNGIEIIRRMTIENTLVPQKGTVISIPIVNVYGFLNKTRELPDGRDLNRSFPGSKDGPLASRIAYILMKDIIPHVDYIIDYHAGGINKKNYPHIRCNVESEKDLELAKFFSPDFILNTKYIDKSFRKECNKKGKSVIVFEGGEALRFDEYAINEGIRGTLSLMKHLKMLDKDFKVANIKSKILNSSSWIRARYSGLFRSYVKLGDLVNKKQILGAITDPFGEFEYKIFAKNQGNVIGINTMPVISAGDAIIHLSN